tara:strand:+ start:102897 stop:103118 length:222 start_codon:yes stop_codon:yes gene_type:complete
MSGSSQAAALNDRIQAKRRAVLHPQQNETQSVPYGVWYSFDAEGDADWPTREEEHSHVEQDQHRLPLLCKRIK